MAASKTSTKHAVKTSSNGSKPAASAEPAVNIGLTADQRNGSIELLNRHLANAYVLYTKTRNYHWNVRSQRFITLHEFFESQYTQLEESIDEYAERAVQLGGRALGTLSEFLKVATLKEEAAVIPDAQTMIANLLADHEAVIRALREDIDETADKFHDVGTSDFLTGKLEEHEKMAWMLRAHLVHES